MLIFIKKGFKMVATETISKKMRIFSRFRNYREIPPAVRAWITIKAKQKQLNPVMVHAGIKAHYARIATN
jgi:hypothetical protein